MYEIKNNFSNLQSDLISDFEKLKNNLTSHKDLNFTYSFAKSYTENKTTFDEVFAKIEATKKEFDSKIQAEFQKLSLLKTSPSEMELKNLPILQEKVNDLITKIKTDNWISEQLKFNDLNKFISEVEGIISKKNKYFDIYSIDNTVISLAFSQLFLTGNIEPEIKKLAKIAIEREILFADVWEENSKTRIEKLNKLTKSLNLAE